MNITQVLHKHRKEILDSKYPASKAFEILCREYGYNYNYARKNFFERCKENNLLANWDNF